jgi:hypothetical protein
VDLRRFLHKLVPGRSQIAIEDAKEALLALERARKLAHAENPAESFHWAVRQSIEAAVERGLSEAESIDRLTIQICYRAADLGYILKQNGEVLSRYSRRLRREPDVEYHEGYFESIICQSRQSIGCYRGNLSSRLKWLDNVLR